MGLHLYAFVPNRICFSALGKKILLIIRLLDIKIANTGFMIQEKIFLFIRNCVMVVFLIVNNQIL